MEECGSLNRLQSSTSSKKGVSVSGIDNSNLADDLSLDGAEAEMVVGGATQMQTEIRHLVAAGYVEEACTTRGTMMFNPKTKKHKLVRYA